MSRTDDPCARSTTDELLEAAIAAIRIYDRMSPDFTNPRNTVKLTDFVEPAPDTTSRLGGWLSRHRTWLPLPVALAILTLRIGEAPPSPPWIVIGVLITAAGELLR